MAFLGLALPAFEELDQVIPSPGIHGVGGVGGRRPGATPVGVSPEEEVGFGLLAGDLNFDRHASGLVGVFAADDGNYVDLFDPFPNPFLPVGREGFVYRPVGDFEGRVGILRLAVQGFRRAQRQS